MDTLTVSLITYVPRFDIDSEKWFVDITVNPSATMIEPFVRLGFVRYQEHARAGLQVSSPVIAWAQVLPRRDLHVWHTPNSDGQPGSVTARLTGAVAARQTPYAPKAERQLPRIRMALMRSETTMAGLKVEAFVKSNDFGPPAPQCADGTPSVSNSDDVGWVVAASPKGEVPRGGHLREWSAHFDVSNERPGSRAHYFVVVEEDRGQIYFALERITISSE